MIHECKACGYRAGDEYDFDKKDIVYEGDQDFIEIEGSFHAKKEDYRGFISPFEVRLIACPKCKTVILDD